MQITLFSEIKKIFFSLLQDYAHPKKLCGFILISGVKENNYFLVKIKRSYEEIKKPFAAVFWGGGKHTGRSYINLHRNFQGQNMNQRVSVNMMEFKL